MKIHRLACLTIVGLCLSSLGGSAYGFWFEHTKRYIHAGYHRNVLWPWPYVCPDREATVAPFMTMVHNGWRRQNLLGPQHFQEDTGALTTAGELKVRWTMTQAPPEYRNLFIERSMDPQITAQRVEAAREYAAQVAVDGTIPMVEESNMVSQGRPAPMVDAINVRYAESMLPPVLPPPSGSTSTP